MTKDKAKADKLKKQIQRRATELRHLLWKLDDLDAGMAEELVLECKEEISLG